MTSGFTRKEAISLVGITSGKISYWDETGLVTPQKIGNPKRPTVIYSWQQILQLQIIDRLRGKFSLKEISQVISFLEANDYNPLLFECNLVFIESYLYLIKDWEEFGSLILEMSKRDKGQVLIQEVGTIRKILEDLRENAKYNQIVDFEQRIKGTPLEAIY